MHPKFRRLISTLPLAAALLSGGGMAMAQEPGTFELEMWRAAVRLHTPEAYQEYLKRFPAGAFAELARQSIRQLGGAPARTDAAPPAQPPAPAQPFAPGALKGAAEETGAANIVVGDVITGPGVTTVGWAGSKRQVVVPPGPWLALAAYDHRVVGFSTLNMTTLVLGQFAGADLRTLLVVTSTSKTPPISTLQTPHPSIPAVQQCTVADETDVFRLPASRGRTVACGFVRRLRAADDLAPAAPGLRERLADALAKVHGRRAPFAWRTHFSIADTDSGFVGYDRFDTAAVERPDRLSAFAVAVPAAAEAATPLAPWLADLARLATLGHAGQLVWPELQPPPAR